MASGRISQMEDTEFMDSSLITVDPDGILPPDSLTSAEEYNPHCTTEVHMVVRDLSSGPVLRDDAYHHPRVTGSHRQFGESDSDIQEWVQSAMEACLSCELEEKYKFQTAILWDKLNTYSWLIIIW